jgi:hypothetical protein
MSRWATWLRLLAAAIDKNSTFSRPATSAATSTGPIPARLATAAWKKCPGVGEQHARDGRCIVCHSQIDNPFSCEKVHAKGDNLKPASQVQGFMSSHSFGTMNLDKASCTMSVTGPISGASAVTDAAILRTFGTRRGGCAALWSGAHTAYMNIQLIPKHVYSGRRIAVASVAEERLMPIAKITGRGLAAIAFQSGSFWSCFVGNANP